MIKDKRFFDYNRFTDLYKAPLKITRSLILPKKKV